MLRLQPDPSAVSEYAALSGLSMNEARRILHIAAINSAIRYTDMSDDMRAILFAILDLAAPQ